MIRSRLLGCAAWFVAGLLFSVSAAGGQGKSVRVVVKDWAGKALATVNGVTFDGTFSLDAKDYFTVDHDIDYVTAFDGGVVSASPDKKKFMSGSTVTWSGLTADLDTEIFVQPFAPIVPRRTDGPDPYCMKDPTTTSAYWVYTYTTGNFAGLYRTTTFDWFNGTPANLSHLASGYTSNVWAPEVHYIDGNWYVYYSASTSSGSDTERSFVMAYKGSNASGLATASNWNTATRLETPDDKWAIDGTVFEANGKLYYVWSGWPGNKNGQQNIYLAPMATPTTFAAGATRTLVSAPTEAWEKHGSPLVNEAPAVLQRNGKVTIVYSGSGSWTQYYALGYATCSDGNFTNPSSWKKHSGAVFSSRSTANAPTWAPGHCSFMQDANGRDYIVYHAQASYDYSTGKWSWPGQWTDRGIRTQPFAWHDDEPVFGVPRPTGDESWNYDTLDYTGSGFETRIIVRPPATATVTLGTPNTIDLDGGAVFEVTDASLKQLKAAGSGKVSLKLFDTAKYVWADTIGIAPTVSIPVTVVDPSGTGGGGDEPGPTPAVETTWTYAKIDSSNGILWNSLDGGATTNWAWNVVWGKPTIKFAGLIRKGASAIDFTGISEALGTTVGALKGVNTAGCLLPDVTSVKLPATLQKIDSYVFYQSGVSSLTIKAEGDLTLGAFFAQESGVRELTVTANAVTLVAYTFRYLTSLTDIRWNTPAPAVPACTGNEKGAFYGLTAKQVTNHVGAQYVASWKSAQGLVGTFDETVTTPSDAVLWAGLTRTDGGTVTTYAQYLVAGGDAPVPPTWDVPLTPDGKSGIRGFVDPVSGEPVVKFGEIAFGQDGLTVKLSAQAIVAEDVPVELVCTDRLVDGQAIRIPATLTADPADPTAGAISVDQGELGGRASMFVLGIDAASNEPLFDSAQIPLYKPD